MLPPTPRCRSDATLCCAVALEGGEVRLYNGKVCVSTIRAADTITGTWLG